jgi:hypothetical protein
MDGSWGIMHLRDVPWKCTGAPVLRSAISLRARKLAVWPQEKARRGSRECGYALFASHWFIVNDEVCGTSQSAALPEAFAIPFGSSPLSFARAGTL